MQYVKLYEEFVDGNKIKCDNCGWTWKLEAFVLRDLEDKYGIDLDLYDNGKFLELSRIVIPKDKRGEGIGSEIMKQINAYADSKGLKIYLTPSKDFGASSTSRLEKFYKDHGFVKNADKSETRNTMVRLPQ
jgi:N-acetylglutamate synthase-like GNAT family acetyltransferase